MDEYGARCQAGSRCLLALWMWEPAPLRLRSEQAAGESLLFANKRSSRGGARSHLGLGLSPGHCECGSQRLLAKSSRDGARSHLGGSSRGGTRSHLGLGLPPGHCECGSQRLLAKSSRDEGGSHLLEEAFHHAWSSSVFGTGVVGAVLGSGWATGQSWQLPARSSQKLR